MRVTPGMMLSSTLRNIELNQARTEQLQNQITSGSRISRPSDDPIGAARAVSLKETLSQSEQYIRNIDQASSWLDSTDSALDAVSQALQRARELAVRAASDTLDAVDRAAIEGEVGELQQHVLVLAQSKHGPYHLFAGTASGQPGYVLPLPSSAAGAYQGNDAPVLREVAPGATMSVSANARQTFDPLFAALETLKTGLSSGSSHTVQQSLGELDGALDAINVSRAELGAKMNRLGFLKERQEDITVNLTGLLSEIKDVDMAEALTNFSMAQAVYQASLKAGARALQPSLLDYL